MTYDVTVTMTLDFDGISAENLNRVSDAVMDQLAERSNDGATAIDTGVGRLEVEVIVSNDDVQIGVAIGQRLILDSLSAAGVHPSADVAVEHQHTLVPA